MTFKPEDHLRKVQGGADYLDVKWRIIWLREDDPKARIETEMVQLDLDTKWVMFRATVTKSDGSVGTGHGTCTEKGFPRGWVEKAETRAKGRALADLNYGTEYALEPDDDDSDGEILADSPSQRPARPAPPARTVTTPAGGVTTPAPSFAAQASQDIAAAHEESIAQVKERVRTTAREAGYTLGTWKDWVQLGITLQHPVPDAANSAALTVEWCRGILERLPAPAGV